MGLTSRGNNILGGKMSMATFWRQYVRGTANFLPAIIFRRQSQNVIWQGRDTMFIVQFLRLPRCAWLPCKIHVLLYIKNNQGNTLKYKKYINWGHKWPCRMEWVKKNHSKRTFSSWHSTHNLDMTYILPCRWLGTWQNAERCRSCTERPGLLHVCRSSAWWAEFRYSTYFQSTLSDHTPWNINKRIMQNR